MWILYSIVFLWMLSGTNVAALCTFPSTLGGNMWHDSDKGDLVFTADQMTGWGFTYTGGATTVDYSPTWECLDTTTDGSDIILIVKSTAIVPYDRVTDYRPFLCLRLRQVTSASYYYYLQYGEQIPMNYERITMIPDANVASVTDPFTVYCLPTTHAYYPTINEYHMLVLNGSESNAIHDCPPAMYELYTYTLVDTDAGTTLCDGGHSRLDMCSDIKRMTFNYTICNSVAAYSANGSMFCLVVLTSGQNTLHTVYNEDTSVDNINTFRFTCFLSSVAADGSVSISVSPRSCTKTQTPTDQPQLGNGTTWGLNMNLNRIQSIVTCDFPCTMPSFFANLNWMDSDKGLLTFTDDSMTGWGFYVYGTLVSPTWKCFHTSVVGGFTYLILRGSTTFALLSDVYRPFLCMKLQQITDVSFSYYLLWSEQQQLGYERVTIVRDSVESDISDPFNELCVNSSVTSVYPTDNEYHLLIKQGSESSAIVDCPPSFYGVYAYTLEDINSGTTFCGSNDSQWDVCTDRQRMAVNYTHCTTTVAYSGSGSLMCVFSLSSGSYTVHTLYNEDPTVDDTNTFRFTCFVSSVDAGGNLTVSQSPRSCTKSQTPAGQPTLTNGIIVGLNLHMSPFVNGLCPIIIPSDSSTTNIAVIVGSVFGSLLLIGLIAAIVLCLYCKLCCFKRSSKISTEKNNNDIKNNKKLRDELNHDEGAVVHEEEDMAHVNKTAPGVNDHNRRVSLINYDDVKRSREDVSMNETLDEDPMLSPSSIDIASLAHIRSHTRMDTPVGTAPGDTHFHEGRHSQLYNPFTLPLLQGKSRTSLTQAMPKGKDTETDALSQSLTDAIDPPLPMQHLDSLEGLLLASPRISQPMKSPLITSQVAQEGIKRKHKGKRSLRKDRDLPDNHAIIASHFQQKHKAYTNAFMNLPRDKIVGPGNDHEFREKKTHSGHFASKTKSNTVLDIKSKEPEYKSSVPKLPPLGKRSKSTKTNVNNLQRGVTFTSVHRNKSGEFKIELDTDDERSVSVLDETSEGIAYDDDNVIARKHAHLSPSRATLRELTSNEFGYGVVKGKPDANDTYPRNGEPADVAKDKASGSDEDESMADNGHDGGGEDSISTGTFAIDNPRLQTAMSVIYRGTNEDPDKMSLRGYNL